MMTLTLTLTHDDVAVLTADPTDRPLVTFAARWLVRDIWQRVGAMLPVRGVSAGDEDLSAISPADVPLHVALVAPDGRGVAIGPWAGIGMAVPDAISARALRWQVDHCPHCGQAFYDRYFSEGGQTCYCRCGAGIEMDICSNDSTPPRVLLRARDPAGMYQPSGRSDLFELYPQVANV